MKRLLANFPTRMFFIALLLRLIPVLSSYNLGIGLDDMFQYDMLARSIVAGNGYRWYAQDDLYLIQPILHLDLSSGDYDPRGVLTSFRPPLYPAFLALIYFITGTGTHRFFIARLAQAFVSAALVPLTYLLAKQFLHKSFRWGQPPGENGAGERPEKAARLAAWVVTLYPMLFIYPLSLATENLFFLLILGSLFVLFKGTYALQVEGVENNAGRSRLGKFLQRSGWFLLAGFILGLASLTRSVSLAFSGLAVLWVWFALKERGVATAMGVVLVATILPWMVRNSLLYQRPTGIENAIGYDLYVSYHPESSGTFQYPQSLDLMSMLNDAERDEVGIAKTREFILADPGRVPILMARRFGYFFGLERRALTYFYSNNFFGYIPAPGLIILASILLLPFIVVSTSACMGTALLRWNKETWLMTILFIGYVTPHILIIAEDRFHLTLIPILAILAGAFWTSGQGALAQRARTFTGQIALAVALVLMLLLLLSWGLELWRDADKLLQLFGPNGNHTHFSY